MDVCRTAARGNTFYLDVYEIIRWWGCVRHCVVK